MVKETKTGRHGLGVRFAKEPHPSGPGQVFPLAARLGRQRNWTQHCLGQNTGPPPLQTGQLGKKQSPQVDLAMQPASGRYTVGHQGEPRGQCGLGRTAGRHCGEQNLAL